MKTKRSKAKKAEYPDNTVGRKLAAEARERANLLTDEQRAEHLEGAKGLIYGRARTKEAVGSRR